MKAVLVLTIIWLVFALSEDLKNCFESDGWKQNSQDQTTKYQIVAWMEQPFTHQYRKVNDKQLNHGDVKMILCDGIKKIKFVPKKKCQHKSTQYGDNEIHNTEKDILPVNDDNDDGPIRSMPSSSFSGNWIETIYTIDVNGKYESKIYERRYKCYIRGQICGYNGCCCVIWICLLVASGLINAIPEHDI